MSIGRDLRFKYGNEIYASDDPLSEVGPSVMNVRLLSFDYLWTSILFAFSFTDQTVYLERPE
jgi:hypothetical protein